MGIFEHNGAAVRGGNKGVAEAGHVHPNQLELAAHVVAGEGPRPLRELAGHHFGHVVAGGHQAVNHAAVQGALPNSEDARVAGAQLVAHHDAAAQAHLQAGQAG